MFLAATNFVIYYLLIKRDFRKIRNNDELCSTFLRHRSHCFITLTLYISTDRFQYIFSSLILPGDSTDHHYRFLQFTDYMAWPEVGWSFMFLLLFAGGCTGPTTGGIKMARHLWR
jgi:trk system potassium uptake protein TrkH